MAGGEGCEGRVRSRRQPSGNYGALSSNPRGGRWLNNFGNWRCIIFDPKVIAASRDLQRIWRRPRIVPQYDHPWVKLWLLTKCCGKFLEVIIFGELLWKSEYILIIPRAVRINLLLY